MPTTTQRFAAGSMRGTVILMLACALLNGASAADEDKAKAVRMKTTSQLKAILSELKIKYPKDADKEKLRSLAVKHDAVSKWEELHPDIQFAAP